MKRKHRALLANQNSMIQRTTLPGRGVFYRLRIGPLSSKAAANRLCNDLKARGERGCIIAPI